MNLNCSDDPASGSSAGDGCSVDMTSPLDRLLITQDLLVKSGNVETMIKCTSTFSTPGLVSDVQNLGTTSHEAEKAHRTCRSQVDAKPFAHSVLDEC
jgi:hypothetical protein